MTTILHVQNLKCGGCARTITKQLGTLEMVQNINVDTQQGTVSCSYPIDADLELVIKKLKNMGYPVLGTANTLSDQAHSFVSCAVGKLSL